MNLLETLLELYYDTGYTAGALSGTENPEALAILQPLKIEERNKTKQAYLKELILLQRRGPWTPEQIDEALEVSNRWGVNCQPSIEVVSSDLYNIGVTYVRMKDSDTLVFELVREFNLDTLLQLASTADDATSEVTANDTTRITLWWD